MPKANLAVWMGALALAPALGLAASLSACGASGGADASGAPTDASKTAFCQTFAASRKHVQPHALATSLRRVGTPANINGSARHGFVVLLDRLGKLPPHADKGQLTAMAKGLTGTDQRDVVAFVTYFTTECNSLPGGFSS